MIGYTDSTALQNYATARGITIQGDPDVMLQRALDYLESLAYRGRKTDSAQALQWPRTGAVVDGILLDPNTVPQGIVDGQHATAVAIDQGNDPLAVRPRATRRERVEGAVEVEYFGRDEPSSRAVEAALRPFLASRGGVVQMVRA